MSQIVSIDMPEALYERFSRAAEASSLPVQDLLVNALATFAPRPPEGLPQAIRHQLEEMEAFSDAQLWVVFREIMPTDEVPEHYVPGDAGDSLMLRKAYAGILLQCRGHKLPPLGTEAA